MGDDLLIAEVARVWVDGRGDADGINWCASRLRDAVQAEIERRRDEAEAIAALRAAREKWEAGMRFRLAANGGLGA